MDVNYRKLIEDFLINESRLNKSASWSTEDEDLYEFNFGDGRYSINIDDFDQENPFTFRYEHQVFLFDDLEESFVEIRHLISKVSDIIYKDFKTELKKDEVYVYFEEDGGDGYEPYLQFNIPFDPKIFVSLNHSDLKEYLNKMFEKLKNEYKRFCQLMNINEGEVIELNDGNWSHNIN